MTVLATIVCVATATLIALGYFATREWSRGASLLQERRATETLALAAAAINRDMKGFWTTVLVPLTLADVEEEPPYDLLHLSARAFARFPYPESLIIWRASDDDDGVTYVFNRADRMPSWDDQEPSDDPFPIVLLRNPPALKEVVAELRGQATSGRTFVLLDTEIAGVPYQVIAHLMFARARPPTLTAIGAFTVNLPWVRTWYFGPLLTQVATIGSQEDPLFLSVRDDAGAVVATSGSNAMQASTSFRTFPFLFLDSAVVSGLTPPRRPIGDWTIHVQRAQDTTIAAAQTGARRSLLLMSLSAVVCTTALILTIRAVRAAARFAASQTDFVSSVTHELKTPLASIRLVGDTLSGGRYASAEVVTEYAHLLSQQAARLTHSIDNLLTYARWSETRRGTLALGQVDVAHLIDEALEQLGPQLSSKRFDVAVDVPRELPRVSVDRAAMLSVIGNIVDNAVKYSDDTRTLRITASAQGRYVTIVFADQGIGIPAEDLPHIFDRFFRAGNANGSGSGLGLAIARRIVVEHGGDVSARSTPGTGTAIDLTLPISTV